MVRRCRARGAHGVLRVVGFLFNRALYSLAVIIAVVSAVFVLVHLAGDPTAGFTAPGASAEDRQRVRERYGLDDPLPVQYVTYLSNAARGDLGESWRAGRPALDAVLERLPATLKLTGAALVLSLSIAVPLGLLAGARPHGALDATAGVVALFGQAIPGFFLATVLILVFAVELGWAPSSGGQGWQSLLLPAVALALFPAALMIRLLRGSVMEAMNAEHIRTARGKGLTEPSILRGHALRNAALPVLAFAGVQAGFLLGGAVVIEGVFAYPGIGQLALNAVADRDLPVIQAVTIVIALGIVLVNTLVDVAARVIDPRLRDAAGGAH